MRASSRTSGCFASNFPSAPAPCSSFSRRSARAGTSACSITETTVRITAGCWPACRCRLRTPTISRFTCASCTTPTWTRRRIPPTGCFSGAELNTYWPRRAPEGEVRGVRGLGMHLTRWPGRGPETWLLLHGWMDTGVTFQFLADALRPERSLIAPDWRGFGASAWPRRLLVPRLLRGSRRADRPVVATGPRHADRSQHGRKHRDDVCRSPPGAGSRAGEHRGIRPATDAARTGTRPLPHLARRAARDARLRALSVARRVRAVPSEAQPAAAGGAGRVHRPSLGDRGAGRRHPDARRSTTQARESHPVPPRGG